MFRIQSSRSVPFRSVPFRTIPLRCCAPLLRSAVPRRCFTSVPFAVAARRSTMFVPCVATANACSPARVIVRTRRRVLFEPTNRDLTRRCICVMHRPAPFRILANVACALPHARQVVRSRFVDSSTTPFDISQNLYRRRTWDATRRPSRSSRWRYATSTRSSTPGSTRARCGRGPTWDATCRGRRADLAASVLSAEARARPTVATSSCRPSPGDSERSAPCTPSFRSPRCSRLAAART